MGRARSAEEWSPGEGTEMETTEESGGLEFRRTEIPLLVLPLG